MDRAIAKTAHQADEVSAGLQVFLDNVHERDAGLYESLRELRALSRGLAELGLDAVQYSRLPTPIETDIRLLLSSMDFTFSRVHRMFGDTRAKKLNGERPYAQVWYDFSSDIEENEGGLRLFPRLELYSLVLKSLLESIRGEIGDHRALMRQRDKLTRLLAAQQPGTPKPSPGYPTSGSGSSTSPRVHFPPMPGAWPSGPQHGFPFPIGPDPQQFMPGSPTMSSASWGTHSTQTSGSAGSFNTHWASLVLTGSLPSCKFPVIVRDHSRLFATQMPSAFARLSEDKYIPVAMMTFDMRTIEAQFWVRPKDHRARLLLVVRDQSGLALAPFCIPLTALKLARDMASLKLFRFDRDEQQFQLWASLNFVDSERLVLFYSIFSGLKHQDRIPPPEGLHEDYFDASKSEVLCFGGQTMYPPTQRHALRIFHDRFTGSVRLEARPLRGAKQHVPLWTAFITSCLRERGWLRRPGPQTVELKHLEQHVFFDPYIPTKGRSGRFAIEFVSKGDCDSFLAALRELMRM